MGNVILQSENRLGNIGLDVQIESYLNMTSYIISNAMLPVNSWSRLTSVDGNVGVLT